MKVQLLQVLESSIVKNKLNKDQINEIPLQIDDYNFAPQFIIASIDDNIIDIMLGSSWLETLGIFMYKKEVHDLLPWEE